jgi:hypothetical protein
MEQAHLSLAQDENSLSEYEALQKARKMKAYDIGVNMAGRED